MSTEISTFMLCLMGIASEVHWKLGRSTPSISPKAPVSHRKATVNTAHRPMVSAPSFRQMPSTTTANRAAGRFSHRCSRSLAESTIFPLTGRERRIHRCFPSRETEGVDTAFRPEHIHTTSTTAMGSRLLTMGSICPIPVIISSRNSRFTRAITDTTGKIAMPRPQLSM